MATDPLPPALDPYGVEALSRELKLVKAQNFALQKQCYAMEEQRDRARELQGSAEEMSSARALEIEALKENLARVRGPECQSKECLDYDGEHPFHQNIAALAHERAQKPMREEIERLKAELTAARCALDPVGAL
jgi:predicted  nucleic acid-binding Zn-ribbon protein